MTTVVVNIRPGRFGVRRRLSVVLSALLLLPSCFRFIIHKILYALLSILVIFMYSLLHFCTLFHIGVTINGILFFFLDGGHAVA